MNLIELSSMSEKDCIKYFEKQRWPEKVTSPFDPDSKVSVIKGKYYCNSTKKYFNVKTLSFLHGSKVPLKKWLFAITLFVQHKKGVSSYSLADQLGVTQLTAWRMLHKIRSFLEVEKVGGDEKMVEVDEAFIGGKNKNRHVKNRVKYSKGRLYPDKVPIIGMLERGGNLTVKVIKSVRHIHTVKTILNTVKENSTLITDEFHKGANKLREKYRHAVLNHSAYEYVNGKYHTNSLEGFWGHLKRGINGIYHQVSRKYMQNYCNEFAFRYNVRNMSSKEKIEYLLNLAL